MEKTIAWEIIALEVNQIEIEESQFNWFPNTLSKKNINSILNYGIQLPCLVQEVHGSKYNLVDGFKRIKCLKSAWEFFPKENINEKITCLVIPRELSFWEVVMIRVETLSNAENKFPGFRVCTLLKMLHKRGCTKNEIANNVLPQLGLESSPRLASQLIDMGYILMELIEDKHFCFSEFLKTLTSEDLITLYKFSGKGILPVLNFVAKMEIRGKKLRYILQILDELIRLRETSAGKILEMKEFKDILLKKNLQTPERYRLIKEQLNSIRYPKLYDFRKKFDQRRENLNLPQRISLDCDKFFEDEDMILKLKFSNVNELKKHLRDLEVISSEKDNADKGNLWEELFSLFR